MTKYVSLVNLRLGSFIAWRLENVPRDSNKKVALAIMAVSLPKKETVLLPLLLARVVDYYQLGKRNKRSVPFLYDSNSPLFELRKTVG